MNMRIDGASSFQYPEYDPSKTGLWSVELKRIVSLIAHGNKEEAQKHLQELIDEMNTYEFLTHGKKVNQAIENMIIAFSQLNSGFPNQTVISSLEDTAHLLSLIKL